MIDVETLAEPEHPERDTLEDEWFVTRGAAPTLRPVPSSRPPDPDEEAPPDGDPLDRWFE